MPCARRGAIASPTARTSCSTSTVGTATCPTALAICRRRPPTRSPQLRGRRPVPRMTSPLRQRTCPSGCSPPLTRCMAIRRRPSRRSRPSRRTRPSQRRGPSLPTSLAPRQGLATPPTPAASITISPSSRHGCCRHGRAPRRSARNIVQPTRSAPPSPMRRMGRVTCLVLARCTFRRAPSASSRGRGGARRRTVPTSWRRARASRLAPFGRRLTSGQGQRTRGPHRAAIPGARAVRTACTSPSCSPT
mmetsp:Transcript_92092/g.237645  ORF Transcript_92092/g.237645 Transcript_92092/m.237645 type:complete len:247 (+) Transcript_92092:303-1043(+)